MGQILRNQISKSEDIEVIYGFDPKKEDLKNFADIARLEKNVDRKADVYVDFTTPDAVLHNVETVSSAGIDSVIGTSGWYDHLEEVKKMAVKHGRRILYSSNFSPGVNVLFYATREVARLLEQFGYDAAVREIHHTAKMDAPSGTAITLGNILLKEMKRERV
jgi:4-hydroxy-tetrahydrodipicolinate reductase